MLPINSGNTSFVAIPGELRKEVYDAADKQTLGRLAQTCKQVNAELNPTIEKVGQEKISPWDALRKREYPNFDVSKMQVPQSAKSLYQFARLQHQTQVRPRLGAAVSLAVEQDHLTASEGSKAWRSVNAVVRK